MSSLFEKLCGRKTVKTYKLDKTEVKLGVLTQQDRDEVLRLVSSDDLLAKSETIKCPTLARAIIEIDGKDVNTYPEIVTLYSARREKYSGEDPRMTQKVAIEMFLGTLPSSVIEALFKAYSELSEMDVKETEGLKKNWKEESQDLSGK